MATWWTDTGEHPLGEIVLLRAGIRSARPGSSAQMNADWAEQCAIKRYEYDRRQQQRGQASVWSALALAVVVPVVVFVVEGLRPLLNVLGGR